MSEFTKGEWKYVKSGCVVSEAGMICDVGFMNVDPEANGQLIAAAPDLLEALKKLFNDCRNESADGPRLEAMQLASAAIAKATHKS